jgi:hypothetical protein
VAEVAGAAAVALVVVLAASYAGYRHKSISVWQVGFLRRPSPTTARPNATEGASTEGDIIVDETRSSTATP